MAKFRTWTIVIHNVVENSKATFKERITRAFNIKRVLLAEEPYNHQEGQHLHIFIELQTQAYFNSVLKKIEKTKKGLVEEDDEGQKGRVQVDQMRGTFEQATAYLQGETKEKKIDEDITELQINDWQARNIKGLEKAIKRAEEYMSQMRKRGEDPSVQRRPPPFISHSEALTKLQDELKVWKTNPPLFLHT